MTCKDCIHSGLCYKENDYENFPDRCGSFIPDKVLDERPQDDLISREALKKAFSAWKTMDDYYHNTDCNDIPFSEVFDLINNAPAVEIATKLQSNCNNLQQGQQGEWEDYSVDFYRCPECGYLLNKDCPHCQNKVILPKGDAE